MKNWRKYTISLQDKEAELNLVVPESDEVKQELAANEVELYSLTEGSWKATAELEEAKQRMCQQLGREVESNDRKHRWPTERCGALPCGTRWEVPSKEQSTN